MPIGTGLGPPARQATRVPRNAWIAPVEIRDPEVPNREAVVEGFTTSLRDYMDKAGYFAKVSALPGRPGKEDVILKFRFDRYQLRRSVHPLNIPLGFLTLTFYYWFGGPVAIDTTDIKCQLTIEQVDATPLAVARKEIAETKNVSVWSSDYLLPSSVEARTEFFAALLDDATRQLNAKEVSHGE